MNQNLVGGFFSCDIDRSDFYEQKVPLFPNMYQRWVITIEKPSGSIDSKIIQGKVYEWFHQVGPMAGLDTGIPSNVRSVKVLAINDEKPNAEKLKETKGVIKVVSPLPIFHTGPLSSDVQSNMLYVAVQFYYDGDATSGDWPWAARGFVIKCPEDVISGLLAVMKPFQAMAPPTLLDELGRPFREGIIEIHDGVRDVIKDIKEKAEAPFEELEKALKVILWGGAAILLFQLFKVTSYTPRENKTPPPLPTRS